MFYRGGSGGSEGSRKPRVRSQGLTRPAGSPSPLGLRFPHVGHLTLWETKNRLGAKRGGAFRRRRLSRAIGDHQPTHLISGHILDTIVARHRAQGHSSHPPLPVAEPQRLLGNVVFLVSRKGLQESESPYGCETAEIAVPARKDAWKRCLLSRKAVWEM